VRISWLTTGWKKKTVGNRWVFKVNRDSERNITKHKARLVAKDYTQEFGVNYTETFSPVVRHSTLRLLFSLAVNLDWKILHWDVVTAFLLGPLCETVYMDVPEWLVLSGCEKVCKLEKSWGVYRKISSSVFTKIPQGLCSDLVLLICELIFNVCDKFKILFHT